MKAWVKGIIAGAVIAVIGVIVLIVGLYMNGWKYPSMPYDFEMRTFTAENKNTELVLNIDAGSFLTEYTDGDRIIIEYPYSEDYQTQITEADGTLTFAHPEKHFFNISFSSCNTNFPQTKIKLPRGIAYNLDLEMNAGSVLLSDGDFGQISIKINAGTVTAEEINCKTFYGNMNAGTFTFDKINCTDFTYKMNAGTVHVNSLTAENTKINMNAGTAKLGFTREQKEYTISADIDAGTCKANGQKVVNQSGTTAKVIDVEMNAGTVKLTFPEED